MKSKNCLVCNSELLNKSHVTVFNNKNYEYDTCIDCGFTFQNPWPSNEIEEIYNENEYWDKGNYKNYQKTRFIEASKRYKKLSNFFSSTGSVLEIGCANGIFLNEWKKNNWKCLGVDPAEKMIESGKKEFNLNLKDCKFEDLEIDNQSFDCIYMWGTDSHFYEFNENFNKIYNCLKKGGIFAMTYQDFKHPIRKIFKNIKMGHNALYNFSKKSILLFMKNLNFELIEHSMTWQYTSFSHLKKIIGLNVKSVDFNIVLPAISFNLIILRKKN